MKKISPDLIIRIPEFAAIYLSALIDGEGCVWVGAPRKSRSRGIKPQRKSSLRRSISIGMTDKEVIDFASKCFDTLGVKHSRHLCRRRPPNKDVYWVSVNGANAIRAAALVLSPVHNGKRTKLQNVVDSYVEPACSQCGVARRLRTRGCEACIARMKYRRRRGLPYTKGKTGRLPRRIERMLQARKSHGLQ